MSGMRDERAPERRGRMRRNLFPLAAAVSAVLFVGVWVLWARSGSRHDALIVRLSDYRAAWVESVRGGVQFGTMANTPPGHFRTGWSSFEEPAGPLPLRTHGGFGAVTV